ncbi:MAG: gamma-glutamyl-gamma-aminobutyrate hydrolase family protein [Planctomycetes bacterium]|nr:gamma-glutamyl-gamma-aminobutyrate hydrolase family protein [Planctomycetota bacterium]
MNRRRTLVVLVALAASLLSACAGPAASAALGDKPLIGIASLASDSYARAVRASGGIPVVLPNTGGDVDDVETYLAMLDGLLMPGGADIPPSEWGEQPHPTTRLLDDDRYRFEKAMITAWLQRTDKPLLGICLGSQWLAVAHGGSLVQDIPSEFGVDHSGVDHVVRIEPGSRLHGIFGADEFEVNSYHHQAVRDAGDGLRVVARSADGIIEATEAAGTERFVVGVQWHPERMMEDDERQARLLAAFVQAAAARRARGAVPAAASGR